MAGLYLRQATASQSRALGPFVDAAGVAQTGLTINNTDIKLVINGAASANKNSGGGTHRVNGVYGVTFDATDTATIGEMAVSVFVSGALGVSDKFFVIDAQQYDQLTTDGTGVTLNLKKLNIVNSAGDAIVASSTGSNGTGINASGNGSGHGLKGTAGVTGDGMRLEGGATSGDGMRARSQSGATSGNGILAESFSNDGDGLSCRADVGAGLFCYGRSGTGPGMQCEAVGGHGFVAKGASAGHGIFSEGGATGIGIVGLGGATSGTGGLFQAQNGDSHGLVVVGDGDGNGIIAVAGTAGTGSGIKAVGGSAAGYGIHALSGTDGIGLVGEGGGGDSYGGSFTGTGTAGVGLSCYSPDNRGIEAVSDTGTGFVASGAVLDIDAANNSLFATEVGDGTLTIDESLRVLIAGMAGILSGAATTTITIRNIANTQNVIVATVDANGNRSAVTVTP